MKHGFTALLSVLLCLLLCSCSMLDRVSSIGSKDKTGTRSKEDWNSSTQAAPPEEGTPSAPDDTPDDGTEEDDGEILALPDEIPEQEEPPGDEDSPAPEPAPDLTGSWACQTEDITGTLAFSGSSVTYTLTQPEGDTVYEGSFTLSGGLLSLSLTGSEGQSLSPNFFLTLESGRRMTLEIVGNETLPGLSYAGDALVFLLS